MDKHAKRSSLLHYPVLIVFTLFFVGLFALDMICLLYTSPSPRDS